MKIPIDRDLRIALLKSLKQGYIDTVDIPGLMKILSKDYNAFLDLMQQASVVNNEETK